MSCRGPRDIPWDEDPLEPREEDVDEPPDEDDDTIPCPYCRREIHEESECCPSCGRYLSLDDPSPARKPWWIVLGTALCLYVVYRWVVWL